MIYNYTYTYNYVVFSPIQTQLAIGVKTRAPCAYKTLHAHLCVLLFRDKIPKMALFVYTYTRTCCISSFLESTCLKV